MCTVYVVSGYHNYAIEHLKHPPTKATTMIKCYICDDLYHHSCVGIITMEEAKRKNAIGEMWFCDYKGCEDAFGEVFDSD